MEINVQGNGNLTGNQNIQVGRDYVQQQTNHTEYHGAHPKIAQYQTTQVRHIPSARYVAKEAPLFFYVSAFLALINFIGSVASISSWLGIDPHTFKQIQITIWFLCLSFGGIALVMYVQFKRLEKNDIFRTGGTLYIKQEDGSIKIHNITAKCPIPGCPGELRLEKPHIYPNQEGISIAGICNKWCKNHIFEFNDETFQGTRINRLTPAQSQQH